MQKQPSDDVFSYQRRLEATEISRKSRNWSYHLWQPLCVAVSHSCGKVAYEPVSVLVVAPTSQLAANLMEWLTQAGCAVILVTSFSAAKSRLEASSGSSHLRSSPRRLQRAAPGAQRPKPAQFRQPSSETPDPVLQREAESLGVAYLTHELDRVQLLSLVEHPSIQEPARRKNGHSAARTCPSCRGMSWFPRSTDRDAAGLQRRRTLGS